MAPAITAKRFEKFFITVRYSYEFFQKKWWHISSRWITTYIKHDTIIIRGRWEKVRDKDWQGYISGEYDFFLTTCINYSCMSITESPRKQFISKTQKIISGHWALDVRTWRSMWVAVMALAIGMSTSFLDRLYKQQVTIDTYMYHFRYKWRYQHLKCPSSVNFYPSQSLST